MLFVGPFGHIRTDFGQDGLGKNLTNTIHNCYIHTREADDVRADIESRLILGVLPFSLWLG